MTTNNIRRLVGPNREMDAEIWRRAGMEGEAPPLTASVDAVAALIERIRPGMQISVEYRAHSKWAWVRVGGERWWGEHRTAPLALCAAIVDALEAEGK